MKTFRFGGPPLPQPHMFLDPGSGCTVGQQNRGIPQAENRETL